MRTTPFTEGWTLRRGANGDPEDVRVPHDAMISERRSSDAPSAGHGGFFPGGAYVYSKSWSAPEDSDRYEYRLRFEGVMGRTTVFVNGAERARNTNGYREFLVPLTGVVPGSSIGLDVHVDVEETPISRWYTGAGLYRSVSLERLSAIRIDADSITVSTQSLEPEPRVEISASTIGATAGDEVIIEIAEAGRVLASASAPVSADGGIRAVLTAFGARPWSHRDPRLYDLRLALASRGRAVDEHRFRTGFRILEIDASRGLRINGENVLLRGAAVHHDNGLLGAATHPAAERRRARLLKDAGYTAIRSAHNPLSRAFLDACDEVGLYVLDELTDVWYRPKTRADGAGRFEDEWAADVDSMINKDRLHPSVILYSIGNEIAEAGEDRALDLARAIVACIRRADPERPTTIAVNPLLAIMASRTPVSESAPEGPSGPERTTATSAAANALTARLGSLMTLASLLPAAEKATRRIFDTVDVAGYNYAYASYSKARRLHPRRVILGTESMPGDLPKIWKRVLSTPGTIGDFMWTGWDYLGEVGLGYWSYGDEPGGIAKPFPGILSGSGAFDITGVPQAALMLARAVWGAEKNPGIAVRPLDRNGLTAHRTPWLASDALPSWSWGESFTGTRAEVEVYSDAEEVELLLNGRRIGRKRAGARAGYVARFTTRYEPGSLEAVAYSKGRETGRSSLVTARSAHLRVRAEGGASMSPDGLAYIHIEAADDSGVIDSTRNDTIRVDIEGPGVLAGLGSSDPRPSHPYTGRESALHRGRALAIVAGSRIPGRTTLTVDAGNLGGAEIVIEGTSPSLDTTLAGPAKK